MLILIQTRPQHIFEIFSIEVAPAGGHFRFSRGGQICTRCTVEPMKIDKQ